MVLEAWVYNPAAEEDRRLPHRHNPNRPVSEEHLKELGVFHLKLDVEELEKPEAGALLDQTARQLGYVYSEIVTLGPQLVDNFEALTDQFFHEHLHPYDESRIILQGSGYWDIPNYDNTWIRFKVGRGDMITLPPGMYHRFTMDTNDYIKAVLLFKEVPERIDLLKPDGDDIEARKAYKKNVLQNPEAHFRTPSPL